MHASHHPRDNRKLSLPVGCGYPKSNWMSGSRNVRCGVMSVISTKKTPSHIPPIGAQRTGLVKAHERKTYQHSWPALSTWASREMRSPVGMPSFSSIASVTRRSVGSVVRFYQMSDSACMYQMSDSACMHQMSVDAPNAPKI